MSEKTEKPTPKKIRDARKKGQVAQSKEVVSALLMCGVFILLIVMSDYYLEHFIAMFDAVSNIYDLPFRAALKVLMTDMFEHFVALLAPLVLLVVVVAIAASVGQFGFLISFESIKPEFKKINPVEGVKKIVSKKSLVEVLKSIVKIAFLGFLIYHLLTESMDDFVKLPHCGVGCLLPTVGSVFIQLFIYSAIAFIVIAVADFYFQKSQHTKQLMMSMDEIKREYKESEGDPEIKGKRKELHKEMLEEEIKPRVKNSTAVITNPTHVAVGIYYEKGVTPLPLVTVMGTDERAQRIKKLAHLADVPMMENVPLARGLLAQAEVDNYIPSEYIEPIVEVLKWVEQLKQEEAAN
ncbi:type III secretion system export apparatus subunit SctU [Thalassomonas viridans]|uniref:Type III secretion system export apparatus subunit SctU n=1 Tax=Thalassomonas viridans TaxID=137584 RepID=A0AAF0CDA5_9GAMM|nr:type III secretion system export apparatus subunit SctU [Thalassomonas viridans]WDE08641.1 type III secretion system export apparatus subunit SctU [Thalassomonas viridans]